MKKYVCEFIGTFILVLFGCGAATLLSGIGIVGVALAFGLAIVAIAYSVGRISGGHVNPAVSLAMLINKKLSVKDFFGYVIAQIAGAFAACGIITLILSMTIALKDTGINSAANGFDLNSMVGLSMVGALIVEAIATCVFVLAILGVTHNEKHSSNAGIVIGLVLALIHIVLIPLTGTSVNPARSLAPAVLAGGAALSQVWVFIVGPLIGAVVAGFAWKFLTNKEEI